MLYKFCNKTKTIKKNNAILNPKQVRKKSTKCFMFENAKNANRSNVVYIYKKE